MRYDLVASSPHVCLLSLPRGGGGIRSSCHSRHSPTHSGDRGPGDLFFRRLIKPLLPYYRLLLLRVRFNEPFSPSVGQSRLNLNFCRGISRPILFADGRRIGRVSDSVPSARPSFPGGKEESGLIDLVVFRAHRIEMMSFTAISPASKEETERAPLSLLARSLARAHSKDALV